MLVTSLCFDTVYDRRALRFFVQSQRFQEWHVYEVLRSLQEYEVDSSLVCWAADGGTLVMRSRVAYASRELAEGFLSRFLRDLAAGVARAAERASVAS